MGRTRSIEYIPLVVHFGYYISPDQDSPHHLLPIYASITTRGKPRLHICAPDERGFRKIVAREFEGHVDSTNFFQIWENFEEYI